MALIYLNYNNFPAIFANGNDYTTINDRKKCLLFNCEVEYFAKVLTKIENEFGRENINVNYFSKPKQLLRPGYALININKKKYFYIRTDRNYTMNSVNCPRIIISEQCINSKLQIHPNNGIIHYCTNSNELISILKKSFNTT